MKKIFTMALATALLTLSTAAQKIPVNEDKVTNKVVKERSVTDAIKEMALTPAIETKLRTILDEAAAKEKALKADATLTDEQKGGKKEAIIVERKNQLKALLGEEKYKQWITIRKKQRLTTSSSTPAGEATQTQQ